MKITGYLLIVIAVIGVMRLQFLSIHLTQGEAFIEYFPYWAIVGLMGLTGSWLVSKREKDKSKCEKKEPYGVDPMVAVDFCKRAFCFGLTYYYQNKMVCLYFWCLRLKVEWSGEATYKRGFSLFGRKFFVK